MSDSVQQASELKRKRRPAHKVVQAWYQHFWQQFDAKKLQEFVLTRDDVVCKRVNVFYRLGPESSLPVLESLRGFMTEAQCKILSVTCSVLPPCHERLALKTSHLEDSKECLGEEITDFYFGENKETNKQIHKQKGEGEEENEEEEGKEFLGLVMYTSKS